MNKDEEKCCAKGEKQGNGQKQNKRREISLCCKRSSLGSYEKSNVIQHFKHKVFIGPYPTLQQSSKFTLCACKMQGGSG